MFCTKSDCTKNCSLLYSCPDCSGGVSVFTFGISKLFFRNNFSLSLKNVFCVDVEGSVEGVGEREIVAPLNGVGSLTLMSDTNHTFFGIFFNF